MCYNGHLGTMGWSGDAPEWEVEIMQALAEFQQVCIKHIPKGHLDDLNYEFEPVQKDILKFIETLKKTKYLQS